MPGPGERAERLADNRSRGQLGAFNAGTDPDGIADAGAMGRVRPSVAVLADRIAATLVHHEPGWRLPRLSVLARRHNATTAEIGGALDQLVNRRLLRRLPDGQLYRASPADYLIQLEGMPGLASHVDPMGAMITCSSFHLAQRSAPEHIAQALRIEPSSVYAARLVWTLGGQPAALATTYLATPPPGPPGGAQPTSLAAALTVLPPLLAEPTVQEGDTDSSRAFRTSALSVEMLPPPPSAARTLRLPPGALATVITMRLDDRTDGTPAALTIVMLRPDMFRIAIEWPAGPAAAPGSQAQALEDPVP